MYNSLETRRLEKQFWLHANNSKILIGLSVNNPMDGNHKIISVQENKKAFRLALRKPEGGVKIMAGPSGRVSNLVPRTISSIIGKYLSQLTTI
jgi:hypothetical protein